MSENPPNALRQKLLQSLRLAVAPMCPVTFCIAPYPKSEIPAALVNVDLIASSRSRTSPRGVL